MPPALEGEIVPSGASGPSLISFTICQISIRSFSSVLALKGRKESHHGVKDVDQERERKACNCYDQARAPHSIDGLRPCFKKRLWKLTIKMLEIVHKIVIHPVHTISAAVRANS